MIRIGVIGTALTLLASAAVSLAAFPGTAHAACEGKNNERYRSMTFLTIPYVDEYPVTDTCNGNNYYHGYFRSDISGWRASVHIQNNGVWESRYGAYDSTEWIEYDFTDDNSHSALTLCLDNGNGSWLCGWGDDIDATSGISHKYTSTTTGF